MHKYRNKIKKIAIVDFDVHHGNGTEDIVKNLQKNYYDLSASAGLESMGGGLSISLKQSICKPWLDFTDNENVLFISLHGYDAERPEKFYPSSGSGQTNTLRCEKLYPAGIMNVPISGESKFSPEYKQIFINKVLPRLHKFKPDLILVSAGFDGHELEEMNLDYMKLNECDYRFITEELMKIANKYSEGRIVSVLEGGYNINAGIVSSFAQSVMTHAKFMNIAANKFYFDENNCLSTENEGGNTRLSSLDQARLKAKRKREFLVDQMNYRTLKKMKVEGKNEPLQAQSIVNSNGNKIDNVINNIDDQNNNNNLVNENSITQFSNVPQDLIKKKNFSLQASTESKDLNQEMLNNIHTNFINNAVELCLDSDLNIYNINSAEAAAFNQHKNLNLISNVISENFMNLTATNRRSYLDDEPCEALNFNQIQNKQVNELNSVHNSAGNQDIDQFINLNDDHKKKEEKSFLNQKDNHVVDSADNNLSAEEELLVEFEDE